MLCLVEQAGERTGGHESHAAECHADRGRPVHTGLGQCGDDIRGGILHRRQFRGGRGDDHIGGGFCVRGGVLHGRQFRRLGSDHRGLVVRRGKIGILQGNDDGGLAGDQHMSRVNGGVVVLHFGVLDGSLSLGDGGQLGVLFGLVGVPEGTAFLLAGSLAAEDLMDQILERGVGIMDFALDLGGLILGVLPAEVLCIIHSVAAVTVGAVGDFALDGRW